MRKYIAINKDNQSISFEAENITDAKHYIECNFNINDVWHLFSGKYCTFMGKV